MIVDIYQTSVGTDLSAVITWLGLGFRGGAACTLVLVYVSIRLRETVSEFRPIENSAQRTRYNNKPVRA